MNKSGRRTQAARRFRYAAYRCGKRQREEERREEVMWCMMVMMETASSLILESLEMTSSLLGRCLWARAWEHCVRRAKANRCQRETTTPSGRARPQSVNRDDLCLRYDPDPGGWSPDFAPRRLPLLCQVSVCSLEVLLLLQSLPRRDAKAAFVTAAIPA